MKIGQNEKNKPIESPNADIVLGLSGTWRCYIDADGINTGLDGISAGPYRISTGAFGMTNKKMNP